jgi:hypothetical protein
MDAAVLEREMDYELLVAGQKVFIYALVHPETRETRYIGKTQCALEKRYREHLSGGRTEKGSCYRERWITSLFRAGLEPDIVELDCVSFENWQMVEKFWIRLYRAGGCRLTNMTDGGDGVGYGDTHPSSKLSNAKAKDIRERYDTGDAIPSLADRFGVDQGVIYRVLRGYAWPDAGGPLFPSPVKRFTDTEREDIRRLALSGASRLEIAALFDRNPCSIRSVLEGLDMKDRRKGEFNDRSGLTSLKVSEARMRAVQEPLPRVAEDLGVSLAALRAAVQGITWKDVTTPPVAHTIRDNAAWLGEGNGAAKLSEPDVIVLRRELIAKTSTVRDLAWRFNVSESAVRRAASGEAWGDLAEPTLPRRIARLTEADRRALVDRFYSGESANALAIEFGIQSSYVRRLGRKSSSIAGSPGSN